jgi:flagellar protein FlaG
MDINPLSAALHNPMVTPSIMADPTPNAAVLVSPAAPAQDNAASGNAVQSEQKGATSQPLDKVLEKLNSRLQGLGMRLQFDIDPELNQVIVSLVDATSGEVLRKIPNDTELHIAKTITRMMMELQGQVVNITV